MKAKYFKKSKLEDKIFHLGVIIQTTNKYKISRKATKQRKLFVRILEHKYKEESREAIVGRLTKYSQEKRNKDQQRALDVKSVIINRKASKENC